jgi:hypothetical protein
MKPNILGTVAISTDRKRKDQQQLNIILFPDNEGFGLLLELLFMIARKILSQIIYLFLTASPSFLLQKNKIFWNITYTAFLRLKVVLNWQLENKQQKCNNFSIIGAEPP